MMTASLLYPRLDPAHAGKLRNVLAHGGAATAFSVDELDRTLEGSGAFPPTGGVRATRQQLLDMRLATIEAIHAESEVGGGAFDIAVGRQLALLGPSVRGELGVPQVWDFLALVLLPDLIARRLADRSGVIGEGGGIRSRLTGGDRRHVLQRLWKRWVVFGAEIVESRALTEDDYVALLERRLTLERPEVARRAARAIVGSGVSGSARREYTRRFMRNLVQMSGVVDLAEHDQAHLDAAFDELHRSTVEALDGGVSP